MSKDDHGHDHGHDHPEGNSEAVHVGTHANVEPSPYARRVAALELLLEQKGVIQRSDVQKAWDQKISRSPSDGAKVVARAWTDPAFKARLLANPRAAVGELGYQIESKVTDISIVENTDQVHHMVVCTLCSCYPSMLLGPAPDWYKSLAYRSRAVSDPRGVMREFGLNLDKDIEVRVLDSTADLRYMVVPRRPEGTEGWSEEELAALVTRDSMIGVTDALAP